MKIKAINTVIDLDMSQLPDDMAAQMEREWLACAELLQTDPPAPHQDATVLEAKHYGSAASYTVHRKVTQAAIAAAAGEMVLIHAGAVANDEGLVLGFVARSGMGKTTATRTLGQRFAYVTDETLACTPQGRVVAFPKPLSIGNRRAGDQKYGISPADAGLKALPRKDGHQVELQLGGIVVLERDEHYRARPTLEAIDPLEGVAQVLAQTSSALLLDDPLQTYAKLCARSGGPWVLRYAEITECLELITELFAQLEAHSPAPTWRRLGPGPVQDLTIDDLPQLTDDTEPEPVAAAEPADLTATFRRCPWVDAVAGEAGEVLVSVPQRSVLLSELSSFLWEELDRPLTGEELLARAQSRFGAHPQAEEILALTLGTLVQNQIIEAD